MPLGNDFDGLSDEQYRELCDCADRLEKTLLNGATAVDLHQYLPPPGAPHRRPVLFELIKTEQEARYRQQQGLPLEEFLKLYPELGSCNDLPATLIYEEFRARRLYGDQPDLETYRRRFPRQFDELTQLLHRSPVPEPSSRKGRATNIKVETPAKATGVKVAATMPAVATDSSSILAPPPTVAGQQSVDTVLSGGVGYRKQARLGRGEFGEVWRALAPGGVEVAVKIITRTLDHEASQRELKILEKIRQLRHPFLLQTHQYQAERDHLIIVLELADGSLSDRFNECQARGLSGIPAEELVAYFAQAADALDYLHSQHIAHRDIKPQNLLMLRGYAKVADFGLARTQDQTVDDASVMCGTPRYMPPEMWRQQVSIHSDQYSLAATYVEMRLGRRLFPGKNAFEIAEHHMKSQPQLDPLPEAEQKVLLRALAKEPNERYPSCTAFAQALRDAVAPPPKPPPPPPQAAPASSWRFLVVAALVALGLIGSLGVLALVYTAPRPTTPVATLWTRDGWQAEDPTDVVHDSMSGRDYYKRLIRYVNGQKVRMLAIPPRGSSDPPLFYMMENKVWNDLYRAFLDDKEESDALLNKYRQRQGSEKWFGGEWEKGAMRPEDGTALGVGEGRGKIPVFRLKVTEAHCFAEWLGGKLPQRRQWLKAVGDSEDSRIGPFNGLGERIAVNLGHEGPWPVDRGDNDISIYGCRQMAGNGREWTRTIQDGVEDIPVDHANGSLSVLVCGQSYAKTRPLVFKAEKNSDFEVARDLFSWSIDEASPEITFRIVLDLTENPR